MSINAVRARYSEYNRPPVFVSAFVFSSLNHKTALMFKRMRLCNSHPESSLFRIIVVNCICFVLPFSAPASRFPTEPLCQESFNGTAALSLPLDENVCVFISPWSRSASVNLMYSAVLCAESINADVEIFSRSN